MGNYIKQSLMQSTPSVADPATIQFDSCIEISKDDYEAFNKLNNLVKVNK